MEAAVSALTRAHEADRADDRDACEQALAQMQRAFEPTAPTPCPGRRGPVCQADPAEMLSHE